MHRREFNAVEEYVEHWRKLGEQFAQFMGQNWLLVGFDPDFQFRVYTIPNDNRIHHSQYVTYDVVSKVVQTLCPDMKPQKLRKGMLCERGWTGDRCQFPLHHKGPCSND